MRRKKKSVRSAAKLVAAIDVMRRDLGLRMPPILYSVAVDYYKKEERREPSPDELLLLERHSAILSKSRHSASVGELTTNDSFVAATYADMMEKRRALNPNHSTAPSLSELLGLANTYLYQSGKSATVSHAVRLELADTHTAASDATRLGTERAAYLLRSIHQKEQPCTEGDLLLILSPITEDGTVEGPLCRLLADPEMPLEYKDVIQIGDMGLLSELLALPLGVDISAARLLRNHKSLISALTDLHIGDYLLRISPEAFEPTAKRLLSVGIRATAFASLSKEPRISVRSGNEETIGLSKAFLSQFYLLDSLKVATADESNPPVAPIFHAPLTAGASKYLDLCDRLPSVNALSADTVVSAATCCPSSDGFLTALDTALAAVFSLAASGIPYTEQSLAVGLAIPRDYRHPTRMGAILSMILGLYRVETELAIRTASSRISTVATDAAPALSLFSLANGAPIPEHFAAEGGYLSLIAPAFDAAGLPDFEALRATLSYLTELAESGNLRSARILARESLADALVAMETETLGYTLSDPESVIGRVPRLAVLCETVEPIDAEPLGAVVAKLLTVDNTDTEITLDSTAECLIPSERPSIVLYCAKEDRDADLLADALAGFDVNVTRIYAHEDREELLLCRAILTSQALIVGLGVELPGTQAVRFAVSTLARAKGQILYPARRDLSARTKGIALQNGFSAKMLRDLCYFEKD